MKEILISIQPKWCELIVRGKKTVEIRKTKPKIEPPFKVYIYCTKAPKGWVRLDKNVQMDTKVIGEFVCDVIISHCEMANADIAEQQGRIRREALAKYSSGKQLYGWHISDLVIYNEPKDLSEFQIKTPPQSWRYVERKTYEKV